MPTVAPAPPARSAHGRPATATAVAVVLALVAAVLAVALGAPATPAAAAPATFRDHPGLVPEQPARGYPLISDQPTIRKVNSNCPNGCDIPREVLATDQVGRFIVSGGNFLNVDLQDGSRLDQPYFTAWNIDTKQIACPGLTFDNEVLKVLPGNEPTTVYVAGRFAKITDATGVTRTRNRVAKIDLATCTVDKTFTSPTPAGKVDELALVGNRLFVGGDFNTIGGRAISTLAELDATTGAVRPAFAFGFSGGLSSRLRGMAVNPAGTRLLVAGRFGTMTGNGVSVVNPTAMIDISGATPTLTRHSSTGYTDTGGKTMPLNRLQDASFSPDGSVVGLAYGTGTIYDYVYLTPMTEAAGTRYRWRHYMRDSSYGIGVSNQAVYVTGHFCKPDGGPGPSEVMEPVPGITDSCTGAQMGGGVWRSKLAALSLTDGTPLTWNPGSHSFRGGQVITVTSRGLLVGFDGSRTNNIRTGALAFFDLGAGAEDGARPSPVAFTAPAEGSTVGDPATISGSATDDVAVDLFRVVLRHDDGRYLQGDGSLSAARYERVVPATQAGTFSFPTSMPAGGYTAEAVAVDVVGKTSPSTTTRSFVQSGVDGAKPTTTLEVPGTADLDEDLTATGVATDGDGVRTLQARVRDAAGRFLQPDGTFAAGAANLGYTTDVPLPATRARWTVPIGSGLPAGEYLVWIRVVDAAGNASTSQRTVSVAQVAPAIEISSPTGDVAAGEEARIAGAVTDAGRVAAVDVSLTDAAGGVLQDDGTVAATPNTLPVDVTGLGSKVATYSWATTLPAGTWTMLVDARDARGTESSRSTTFRQQGRPFAAITGYTGYGTGSTNGTLGYTFTVGSRTTLSAIGVQDTDRNGRLDNDAATGAGIWRQGNATALATTSLPPRAPATAGWAYGDLESPVVLEPGVTYVVAAQSSKGERYASGGTATTAPGITITGRAAWTGNGGLRYPTSFSAGTGYGMPNLRLQ